MEKLMEKRQVSYSFLVESEGLILNQEATLLEFCKQVTIPIMCSRWDEVTITNSYTDSEHITLFSLRIM